MKIADSRIKPTFELEAAEHQLGSRPIAGVDEAGRGPWAGPVVAAAVILDPDKIARIAAVLGVTAEYLVDPTETVQMADAADEAFFRKYRRMNPDTKEKIRQMVELWGDDK